MRTRQSSRWEGISCESDAWPYSPDPAVFEARRAVGQMVRTCPGIPGNLDADPVLLYVYMANVMETAVKDIIDDLIAEARARGIAWVEIGRTLGVGDTAAQKRFGKDLGARRIRRIHDETTVTQLASVFATTPHDLPDDLDDDLAGTTPTDRLDYAVGHIQNAANAFRQIDELLERTETDTEETLSLLNATHRKLARATFMLAADQAQWEAMAGWSDRAENIDQANYYAPTTYLLYTMRQVLLACLYHRQALDQECRDSDRSGQLLSQARGILATVILVLNRDDVRSVLTRHTERDTATPA